jgi:hypothetical protein
MMIPRQTKGGVIIAARLRVRKLVEIHPEHRSG